TSPGNFSTGFQRTYFSASKVSWSSLLSVSKKWLFWFFESWLVCRQKPNVLECAVGIISLSFTLFTVVVFLALAVTSDCEKTHNLSNKYSKKLVRKAQFLYFYLCNTSKEFLAINYK